MDSKENGEAQLKTHSGYFQIHKEYPELYSSLLMMKQKLKRCPEDWKNACEERLERLLGVLDEVNPESMNEKLEKRCGSLIATTVHYTKCKTSLYSAYSNKMMTETKRLETFLTNISKYG